LHARLLLLPLLFIGCRGEEPTTDPDSGGGNGNVPNSGGQLVSSGGGSSAESGGASSGGADPGVGGMGGASSGDTGGSSPAAGGATATGTGGDATLPLTELDSGPLQQFLATIDLTCDVADMSTTCNPGSPNPCIPGEPKITCGLVITDGQGAVIYDGLTGIEGRGRSSLNYNKPNYALEFRNADGTDNPVPCLGMGKESDWLLDGSWVDRSLIRNSLASDLFDDMGLETHHGAESRFARVTLNGEPSGLYRLTERIKADDDRIDIPPDPGDGSSLVLKLDEEGPFEADMGFFTDRWQLVTPNPANLLQQSGAFAWLGDVVESLDAGTPFETLTMETLVDWVLLQEFTKNIDGYHLSVYFSKTSGALGNIVPWDFDLSFGQPTIAMDDAPEADSPEGWLKDRPLFVENLFRDPAFQPRLVARWGELRERVLRDAALMRRIDEYLVVLNGAAIDENFQVWPMEDVQFTQISEDYSLYPVETHSAEIARLRTWILARTAWMDANIESL
jgi:hypothetical protein